MTESKTHGVDLDSMNKEELLALKKDVDKAINSFDKRRLNDAISAARKVAQEHGFNLDDLLAGKAGKTRAPVAPKYAHPDDASKTWTGRGRQPFWVRDALAEGKTLEDLAI